MEMHQWGPNVGLFVVDSILKLLSLFLFVNIGIEHLKTKIRSTVSVREGQGVVLLCGAPVHPGGKETGIYSIIDQNDWEQSFLRKCYESLKVVFESILVITLFKLFYCAILLIF